MKLLKKPVQMIVWHDFDGTPHPVRFRYEEDNEQLITVKIKRSIRKDMNKFAGKKMLSFECQLSLTMRLKDLRYGMIWTPADGIYIKCRKKSARFNYLAF